MTKQRSINNSLNGYKKAKGKQSNRSRYQRLPKYETALGLRPGPAPQAGVVIATCKFCSTFGREEKKTSSSFTSCELISSKKKKPKKSTRVQVFDSFRIDNIKTHLELEHPQRWTEYQALPNTASARNRFFEADTTITSFLPGEPAFEFRVPSGVADTIKPLFDDPLNAKVFSETFEEDLDASCVILVDNRDQFDVVVECIAASTSSRGTVKT